MEGKAHATQAITDSPDESQKRSARAAKSELKAALEAYSAKVGEYDAAIIALEACPDRLLIEETQYYGICKITEDLIIKLEAIAVEAASSRAAPVAAADAGVVKLQKITCPKFSSVPRDFAQFKRDFNPLVAVPRH